MSNILVVPDLHLPFQDKKAIRFIEKAIKNNKIDEVVFLGDVVDFYTISNYEKHPEAKNIKQEIKEVKKALKNLTSIIPKAKICLGNHEMRLYKRAQTAGFYNQMVKSLNDLLDLPDSWEFGERFEIDGVLYMHGDGLSGRQAAASLIEKFRKPCVIGHLHGQFTLMYLNNGDSVCWACVAGCLVDSKSYAMAYGKYSNDRPVLGLTFVENRIPRFIPMLTK